MQGGGDQLIKHQQTVYFDTIHTILMDFTLQVHEAKYIFPIPDGLKELSSDIIREVLRHQPSHINGFIADYLETMLTVREHARDAGVVVCDAFREGYFFDELFRTKNINREQANFYATIIQASWRGYVVRRKISEWLKKKKKFEEEQERKRSLKIEELLAGLGITYDEARRAAGLIQSAYKESKRGKWIVGEVGEFWVGESIPFGQRLREGDRVQGRYDRWDKEDFGDFFEMDTSGAIKYIWPKVGQLRKVLRDEVPKDVPIVEFFAMRDLKGQEQYSYLIKSQPETEFRGVPIGFLIPLPKSCVLECSQEVEFVSAENDLKMGTYTYIYRDDVEREDLEKFEGLLRSQEKSETNFEMLGEIEYDPGWVLPRVLVRIKKDFLLPTDHEVKFASLPEGVVCEEENYTFRAETIEQTEKIVRHILRNKCLSVEEGLMEAGNMKPYKFQETGRIFPVDKFTYPSYIQKIIITPESTTAEDESMDLMRYTYIFLPLDAINSKKFAKGESIYEISVIRFQGFHSDYRGSADFDDKVFIMGPKITTPDGKPFTYESFFWDEFGEEAWWQLLYNLDTLGEAVGEQGEEEGEGVGDVSEVMGEIGAEEFHEKDTFKPTETAESATEKPSVQEETEASKSAAPETISAKPSTAPTPAPSAAQGEEGEGKTEVKLQPPAEPVPKEEEPPPPKPAESEEKPPEESKEKLAQESQEKPPEESEEKPEE